MTAPIARAWWVIPGKLLAGGHPGTGDDAEVARQLGQLLDGGIRAVVCLQEPEEKGADGEPLAPYDQTLRELARERGLRVPRIRIPMPRGGVPTTQTMQTALDVIDAFLEHNLPVCVHGTDGRGRAATVIGCWLVRHHMDGEGALRHIAALRHDEPSLRDVPAPERPAQCDMVRRWAAADRAGAEAPAAAARVSRGEPVGTRRAVEFMKKRHMTPCARGEAAEFQFHLGERRKARSGEARTIIGYALDPAGVPKYIVEMAYGTVAQKTARKANREYSRPIGTKLSVLADLVAKGEAADPGHPADDPSHPQ